jgi:transcriptional regulator with XRE-family HTH domain
MPPPRGETFRRRRLERGVSLGEAAAELGIPASSLRAIEWDRSDLLSSPGDVERIAGRYGTFLDLDNAPPPAEMNEEPPASGGTRRAGGLMARYGEALGLAVLGIVVAVMVFVLLNELA